MANPGARVMLSARTPRENVASMELFLIDAIGPFFGGYRRHVVNWSKIPFEHLPTEDPARAQRFARIARDLDAFAARIAAIGYNAVTLDDVAHLVDHPWYEPEVRRRIRAWRASFRPLIERLAARGLGVYVTADAMSYTPALERRLGASAERTDAFAAELLERFLDDFPMVEGVIVRIGESDGLDVGGMPRSRLYLHTPAHVNRFLRRLLPVFERRGRRLLLRTWTVGAYPVGDLMWNRSTLARILRGIDSPALALSIKHGESDFFRYLPVNDSFFRTDVPKVLELQAKREHEGCGEFPSFVGWEHERLARELEGARNLIGVSVWCQTGGWVPFRRLAFVGSGSPWTEINAAVTLGIFKHGLDAESALRAGAPAAEGDALVELMRLSDQVVAALLYTEEFARQKLFFRRVKVPPLAGVYWNHIFVNHPLRKVLRCFVADPERSVRAGREALERFARMRALAARLDLPADDIDFMRATFEILALAREYFLEPYDESRRERLERAKRRYQRRYPRGSRYRYTVRLDFRPFPVRLRVVRWALSVALRRQRGYRALDRLVTLPLTALAYRSVRALRAAWIPEFVRTRAMGIDAVFK